MEIIVKKTIEEVINIEIGSCWEEVITSDNARYYKILSDKHCVRIDDLGIISTCIITTSYTNNCDFEKYKQISPEQFEIEFERVINLLKEKALC
jgi:hypothetical protein